METSRVLDRDCGTVHAMPRHRPFLILLALCWWLWDECPSLALEAGGEDPVEQDDPTRPVTNLDLRPHFEDNTTTTPRDRLSLIFRRNVEWDLSGQFRLATRIDFPLTFSDSVTETNPGGQYRMGMGRPLVQVYVADVLDDRWAIAVGSQIVGPASGSEFGSGNWDAVPIVALRYSLPEITPGSYFVPQLRYAVSFAQSYEGRKTNNLQFSPQLKIPLDRQWFVIFFPTTDIRINFGDKLDGQTGRLFLPLDGAIGCNIGEASVISLEVGAPIIRDYPVYRLKIEARFSVQL